MTNYTWKRDQEDESAKAAREREREYFASREGCWCARPIRLRMYEGRWLCVCGQLLAKNR